MKRLTLVMLCAALWLSACGAAGPATSSTSTASSSSSSSTIECTQLQADINGLYKTLSPSKPFPQAGVKLTATSYSGDLPEPGPELTLPDEGNAHVAVGQEHYAHMPPASGPHFDQWAPSGFSTKEIAVGNWVHTLEHGGVVLLYNCASGRVTMVAWTHQLPLAGFDAAQITAFYDKYVDQGPEKVP